MAIDCLVRHHAKRFDLDDCSVTTSTRLDFEYPRDWDLRLELTMLFRERFAGRGFVVWILCPAYRSSIVGLGYKIDSKNFQLASELIAFPLL